MAPWASGLQTCVLFRALASTAAGVWLAQADLISAAAELERECLTLGDGQAASAQRDIEVH